MTKIIRMDQYRRCELCRKVAPPLLPNRVDGRDTFECLTCNNRRVRAWKARRRGSGPAPTEQADA